jgi:L-ascorbate metabolism protein UlaG (beta-lactamase superfamily)
MPAIPCEANPKGVMKTTRSVLLPLCAVALFVTTACEPACAQEQQPLKSFDIAEGDACIWYLFHSGWAVKTKNHFLIFDYWENDAGSGKRTLGQGFINPDEIADENVFVFVSHKHSDHYDPVILSWRKRIPRITYIWGWKESANSTDYHFDSSRTVINVGGMKIYNVHHEFDGIPESAFLVHVDGIWLYHAGDHSHSAGEKDMTFKENIEYLASLPDTLDIMFTPTWGGELYAIQRLSPNVVFPMHDGGREHQYERFARKVKGIGMPVQVGAASKRGDCFFYRKNSRKVEMNPR